MLIVSDTTAVSNLLQIDALELLQKIYGKVIIPTAVEKELLALEKLDFPIQDILAFSWIEIKTCSNLPEAKRKGYLRSVQDTVDKLKGIGFWISNDLYQQVLAVEKNL